MPTAAVLRLGAMLLALLLALDVSAANFSDNCTPVQDVPSDAIKVGIRLAPPFVQLHPIRGLEGISIDLWKSIAQRQHIAYRFVCLDLDQTLASLGSGAIDVAISPLTISQAREEKFDFSHQYFASGLVFAGRPDIATFDFRRVLKTLWQAADTRWFLIGATVFLVFTFLLFRIVMKYNQYYNSPLDRTVDVKSTSLHILLMAALNMTGMRKDIFSFRTVPLQLMFLIVMALGATLSASLGGIITASILSSVEQGKHVDVDRLREFRISTLKGSTAEAYLLEKNGGKPGNWLRRDSWKETLDDVTHERADLVVGDWVQLAYLANANPYKDKIQIDAKTIRFEPYAWGFPLASRLRKIVNQEMIGILRSDAWPGTIRGYIGGDLLKSN